MGIYFHPLVPHDFSSVVKGLCGDRKGGRMSLCDSDNHVGSFVFIESNALAKMCADTIAAITAKRKRRDEAFLGEEMERLNRMRRRPRWLLGMGKAFVPYTMDQMPAVAERDKKNWDISKRLQYPSSLGYMNVEVATRLAAMRRHASRVAVSRDDYALLAIESKVGSP